MERSIFTRIIAGEIPCSKVYEDEHVFAFLDINPINKGHTLVIPKEQYADLFDIPDNLLSQVSIATKKISIAIMKATGAKGVNILQNNRPAAGQIVFHYHNHIIPRFENDGKKLDWVATKYEEGEKDEIITKILANL
eukprot:TRINITY_DN663_c0_g2_i1.p1 TRINITY_DN663_c0_g2~~TRINITY_DN663_c0_g2_i1.p1  ORF type:complete len:137 (+),score=71.48 TRINITY_DN663_c0_g2_i1:71-481(+)